MLWYTAFIVSCLIFSQLPSYSGAADDKEMTKQGVTVNVLGKSGKVRLGKSITMEMDKIAEYDTTGNEVGTSGNVKHSLNSFATLDFTFSEIKSEKLQNLDVDTFNFTAHIQNATLIVRAAILKENGTIVNDDEEIKVNKGMVKIDITIKDWLFCNPCKKGNNDEIGSYLEFTITIKGKKNTPEKKPENGSTSGRKKPDEYDLGDKATLILSKKYKDNEIWKDMASDYPKLVERGSKQSFVFRFEKFDGTIFYDPNFDVGSPSTDSGEFVKASFFITILSFFVVAFKIL